MNRRFRTAIAALVAALSVVVAIAPVASAAPVLGKVATVAPTNGGTSAQRLRAKEKESEDSSTEKISLSARIQ